MVFRCGEDGRDVLQGAILIEDDEDEEYCCYPKPKAAN
jgi:hypothetical protein